MMGSGPGEYRLVDADRAKASGQSDPPSGAIAIRGKGLKVYVPIAVISLIGPALGVFVGKSAPSDLEQRFEREAQLNAEFREDTREQLRAIREAQMHESNATANRLLQTEVKTSQLETRVVSLERSSH